nr:immunoglobulin heavy chain junction region [Mus musculus]
CARKNDYGGYFDYW